MMTGLLCVATMALAYPPPPAPVPSIDTLEWIDVPTYSKAKATGAFGDTGGWTLTAMSGRIEWTDLWGYYYTDLYDNHRYFTMDIPWVVDIDPEAINWTFESRSIHWYSLWDAWYEGYRCLEFTVTCTWTRDGQTATTTATRNEWFGP
jgi:hypothetical protein